MATFERIGTINIAVRSAQESMDRFRELGFEASHREIIDLEDPPAQIRYFQIPIGDSSLSLVEAADETSPVARFLGKHGEGMFSINIVVDDLAGLMEEWSSKGIAWVLDEPMSFHAEGGRAHSGLVNWVHPSQLNGMLLEFTERLEA